MPSRRKLVRQTTNENKQKQTNGTSFVSWFIDRNDFTNHPHFKRELAKIGYRAATIA
ncbi:hypothetical protein KIN20_004278 [Parelaphostrongylus tenuis]|uniref:Uncharacterized protein n=1 Tax=Parelaphostrongylus tenuis TaxID=148309 RepID=A0AAD5M1G4_PARTN|nr:hypothetical protein KIN20_004278 [Parelaphostrongylus tenuis]